jgi:hypothetical protein
MKAALLLVCSALLSLTCFAQNANPARTEPSAADRGRLLELVNQPPGPPLKATAAPEQEANARYLAIFATPISFYGKVVDQEGKPVDGAKVKYETGDQPDPNRKATSWTIATDGKGEFSIVGKGAQLYVETSRDGYYRTPNIGGKRGSFDAFPYAMRSPADPPLPTKDSPAIFVLRKKGAPAALTHSMADTKILKDGTPVEISLTTSRSVPLGQGDIRVEAWTDDQNKTARGRYNWRCRVTVLEGGLARRYDDFDFQAPTEGYALSDEFGENSEEERWHPVEERDYFLKLRDGRFARMKFSMAAGGAHFVEVESYVNPNPGDRNLEYEKKLEIATPSPKFARPLR